MALPTALRPSSAAQSCRWPGRPRSSCSPAPSRTAAVRSGRYRPHSAPPTGSRSDSAEGTAAAPWAPTACTWPPWCSPPPTRPCCPRARRRAAPPAGRRCRGSSRSTRCSAPRRGTPPRRPTRRPRSRRSRSSSRWSQNSSENSRYPSYSTQVRQQQLADDATRKLKLQARLVQPGRVGGWVAGNLSWSRLDYMLLRDEFPPAHVRLLHELFALYRASTTQQGYYTSYSYGGYGGDQKYLDLSSCESHQLWPVLDQAHELGLPFVYRGKQGMVPPPGTAELTLDVTSDETTLLIAPVIKTSDGADAVPLRFIGSEGHGVIYTDRGAGQSRRARPVPAGPARAPGARPAPAPGPGRRAAGGAGVRAGRVPVQVLPEAAPDGRGDLLRRIVHGARDLRPGAGGPGRLRPRPPAGGPLGVVVPGRRDRAAGRAGLRARPVPRFAGRSAGARRPRPAVGLAGGSPRSRPGSDRTVPALRLHPQRSRHDDLHHRGAAAAVRPRRCAPRGDRAGARLPRGRGLAGDRGVGRRARRRRGLVRPRHRHHRRGQQGPVHRAVRRAGERPVAPAAGRRRVLLARQARAGGPRPAHRRGADAAGPAGRRPPDQPVPGRAVGGAGRPGRGQPPGGRVAAPGQRAARHRRRSKPRRSRRRSARNCARTSCPASSGSPSCGRTASAASSPTTWGSARRCRRWR